jgi:hypothetical protein
MNNREGVRMVPPDRLPPIRTAATLPTEPAMPASRPTQGGAWLKVPGTVKSLREVLCSAQAALLAVPHRLGTADRGRTQIAVNGLQGLIDQLDLLRPLGPDGVHGDRHTPFCGCER